MLRLIALTVLLLAASACTTKGAFFTDERVEITSPEDRSTVTLPMTVRWSVEDFDVTGPDGAKRDDAGYFALFLDRDPMAPGKDLRALVDDDRPCAPGAGCPDLAYLAERNVFTTTQTSFPIVTIADRSERARSGAADRHDLTIVLLNGAGQRIGESAFNISFTVDRGNDT